MQLVNLNDLAGPAMLLNQVRRRLVAARPRFIKFTDSLGHMHEPKLRTRAREFKAEMIWMKAGHASGISSDSEPSRLTAKETLYLREPVRRKWQ